MEYFVYILYSNNFNKYYIGQTNNLEKRIKQHNENEEFNSFTKKYRPWILIYKESCESKSNALKLEKYLKSLKNKERIRQYIAGWRSSISGGS